MSENGNRAFVSSLPLPLARAWRRVLYVEQAGLRHERTLHALEAALKYVAAAAASAWVQRGARTRRSSTMRRFWAKAL